MTVTQEAPEAFAEWMAARGGALQRFAYLTTGSADDAAEVDDGTNVRELTTADCRPLFGSRTIDTEGIGRAFERCSPPRRR